MKIKTLVIDDDPHWQKIISKMVEVNPFLDLVGVCSSTMEAYGKLADTELLICDIELPPFLPKGSPVELTYTYNENQVLEVIVDAYGRQNRVQIARNTGLSDSEIEAATADLLQIKVV